MAKREAPPLLGFVASSGTGKTTLLERLLPLLAERGVRVALIKHSHHDVDLDTPGKDSHRLRLAGAAQVMLASKRRWALMTETPQQSEPRLEELVDQLDPRRFDLVLVEGFKQLRYPRIELHRAELHHPLQALHDPSIIAIATNCLALEETSLPLLDLNNPDEIAEFILHLYPSLDRRPESVQANTHGVTAMSDRPISSQASAAPTTLLPVADALARIKAQISPITPREKCQLGHALGRVLASPIVSPMAVPSFDNSAMDGYALRHADLCTEGASRLRIIGTSYAGTPFAGALNPGEAVRIMTGAKLPQGADSVVMQEQTEVEADLLTIQGQISAGENVRRMGEELSIGGEVLAAGRRLSSADIGLLASIGIAEVEVVRRIKVAMFSTGDELCTPGRALSEGQIYDTNRYSLQSLLKEQGIEIIDLGIIEDSRDAVASAFAQAAELADAVITSGGVSVGDADYVKECLDNMGEIGFWRIAMKPGKPLAYGRLGSSHFFGLPGNPVSAMITFHEVVLPALRTLQGEAERQPLRISLRTSERLKKRPGRADYQRGIIYRNEDGELCVRSTGHQGSHMLTSVSQANCLIILPTDSGNIEAGEMVEVEPLSNLI